MDLEMMRRITVGQHGLVRTDQLASLGATRWSIAHALRIGLFERLSPEVLRLGGAPATVAQRRLASLFDAAATLRSGM